jgi:hypothetical protein
MYSSISDQKLIVITIIFEVVKDVESIFQWQLDLILSFLFFFNGLQ